MHNSPKKRVTDLRGNSEKQKTLLQCYKLQHICDYFLSIVPLLFICILYFYFQIDQLSQTSSKQNCNLILCNVTFLPKMQFPPMLFYVSGVRLEQRLTLKRKQRPWPSRIFLIKIKIFLQDVGKEPRQPLWAKS